jgi:dipeptidyl aminopeptidase/acylaminoacyl peptidase
MFSAMTKPLARILLVLLFASLFTTCLAFSADRSRFTLEQVMSSPFPSGLVAAEHANRVAWVFNAKGGRNVWVADAPNFAARQVTHYSADDGMPLASLKLTPDGKTAVYARGSEANDKGEVAVPTNSVQQPKQQVWAVDVDGGEPRLLGDMGCEEEGCEDIEISPDGRFAVWAAKKQLWIAPVNGSEKAKQMTYARGDNQQPKWSPDGKKVAFVSKRDDHAFVGVYEFGRDTITYLAPIVPVPWSIWVAEPNGANAREVWHSGTAMNDSYPSLIADTSFAFAQGRIVFASEQDGWAHLYWVGVGDLGDAGGTGHSPVPTQADGKQADSGGAQSPGQRPGATQPKAATQAKATLLTPGEFEIEDVWLGRDYKTIYYTSNQGDIDRRHIWRVSTEGGAPMQVTRGGTMEVSPVQTGDGNALLCLGSTATSPLMPYVVTASGREMIAKQAQPADFPSAQLVTPKQVVFKSEDGWTIHGQLFEPKNASGKLPGLVFIHGGSMRQMMLGWHYMEYYHNAYAENQYLASLGYVVLSVNYRTGIMYGRAFRTPADGGWRGGAEYKDIVAAGKYLQSLPNVDAKRVGLWGGSYGGYLTAMGLARNSEMFAAGVDLHGVHDWAIEEEGEFPKDAPDLQQANKLAFESSPNASIATWRSPVLLIQGDDDRNVPFAETVTLAQLLRQRNVTFEEIVFPDEIHDFLLWRSWIRAYDATANFFDRKLKNAGAAADRTLP